MKSIITAACLALSLAGTTVALEAATLGLTTETPSISASNAIVDYVVFAGDGDISAFGAEVDMTTDVSPMGFTELGFGLGFDLSDPATTAAGGFDIFDDDGLFLSGELVALGFAGDVLELQFGTLSGSAAGAFGASALALVTFDEPRGPDLLGSLVDGDSLTASISLARVSDVSVAAVPLAPSLAFLLAAFGALSLMGRRWRRP